MLRKTMVRKDQKRPVKLSQTLPTPLMKNSYFWFIFQVKVHLNWSVVLKEIQILFFYI